MEERWCGYDDARPARKMDDETPWRLHRALASFTARPAKLQEQKLALVKNEKECHQNADLRCHFFNGKNGLS